ncbi:HAD family hydrolase [Pseudomonas oryzihabitans]|uniref:HAD family hydrolase n=1 Tax=Pseudomonas oryzihabitans TaxID=47885 RepID=A0ABX3IW61_9PSED|nr:HAD family hydrolase [Pseudomonas psychrotolerans]ONN72457.1 hypothetical protein BVL52_01370 [Pseudomonas psychrotolerans]
MKIVAVIFDAFGTLVRIQRRTNPFRSLLLEGRKHGRRASAGDLKVLMTQPLSLEVAAEQLRIQVSDARLQQLQTLLDEELDSIAAFPDGLSAVAALQQAGLKIGICSNLAAPYGESVRRLFPTVNATGFSYEVGATKPCPLIYESICADLGVTPGHFFDDTGIAVMIGDSLWCDCYGARAVGINGVHLQRSPDKPMPDLHTFSRLVLDQLG